MPRLVIALLMLTLLVSMSAVAGCADRAEDVGSGSGTPPARTGGDGDGMADAEDAATGAERAVSGSVDLEPPAAGPPDAGTQGGHRAGAARGQTRAATFSFGGAVSPANSEVTIAADGRGGAEATVRAVGDRGDFTVEISGLRRGTNRFTLRATAPGHHPWTQDVAITRSK